MMLVIVVVVVGNCGGGYCRKFVEERTEQIDRANRGGTGLKLRPMSTKVDDLICLHDRNNAPETKEIFFAQVDLLFK